MPGGSRRCRASSSCSLFCPSISWEHRLNAPATSFSPARSDRTILAVDDLVIALMRGTERHSILDGVSFSVPERGLIGIVGESGSGKTVLGRALTGWVPEPLRQTGGSVAVAGRKLDDLTSEELRQLRG